MRLRTSMHRTTPVEGKLWSAAYMYTFGSAGTGSTYRNNLEALQQWRIIPRMLRDATHRNLDVSTALLYHWQLQSRLLLPDDPLWRPVALTHTRSSRWSTGYLTQRCRARNCERSRKRRRAIHHVDGKHALHRSSGQGQQRRAPLVSTILVRLPPSQTDHTVLHSTRASRPRTNEVTLSILRRIKAAGFTALVVTVDTFALGWRPHDLDTAYLPFIAGVGVQVGTSDPVFMRQMGDGDANDDGGGSGLAPRPDERPSFPLDLDALRARLAAGDEQARVDFALGTGWLREAHSGTFRSWTDIAFLRKNWDGPIVLKGIQAVQDAHAAMDAHVDGIIVSNHGTSRARGARSLYSHPCPACGLMAPLGGVFFFFFWGGRRTSG